MAQGHFLLQGQFLLFVVALLPFLSYISLRFLRNYPSFYNFLYFLLPIFFLINLFQASKFFVKDQYQFTLFEPMQGVSLAFYVDKIGILFLYILGFVWLIFAFYAVKYFKISFAKNSVNIREFFVLIISLVNFLILSKNLFTILFFYIYLIISSHFFSIKHFNIDENKFTKFFTFILYLESFLVFLSTILTFRITENIDFVSKIIIPDNYHEIYHFIIFLLFFFGLFLLMLTPFYLLFKNIKFNSLTLLIILLLSYALPSIFMFLKIIYYIFGIKGFGILVKKFSLKLFEVIILVNLLISSYKYLREKDLKSGLFYLFISQFGVMILSILIHLNNKFNYTFLCVLAFILNFMLIFFTSANFELFLNKIHFKNLNKNFVGIFYKMPINSSIFLFAIMSLLGLTPSLSGLDKFLLITFLLKNPSSLSLWIFVINFIFLTIFIVKESRIFFSKNSIFDEGEDNKIIARYDEVAKVIDNDSNLILTILVVAICSVVSLFFNKIFYLI